MPSQTKEVGVFWEKKWKWEGLEYEKREKKRSWLIGRRCMPDSGRFIQRKRELNDYGWEPVSWKRGAVNGSKDADGKRCELGR
jgi:hypothetical protein